MKMPDRNAPIWRWRLYNNIHGYSEPGKSIRFMLFGVKNGLSEGWFLFWRWLIPVSALLVAIKEIF